MINELYRGGIVRSDALPWHYIPTWIGITTPPVALLFAALGAAAIIRRAAANPAAAVRNPDIRFGLVCAALFALPIAAAAALGSTMYNGWRHMHFLWAPLCIIAAFALHMLPQEFKRPPLRTAARSAAAALMCAGLAASLIAVIQIHPHQHSHFNAFVDRSSPEKLRKQYSMDYWDIAILQMWRRLLELHPSGPIFVNTGIRPATALLLPESQRYRILVSADGDDPGSYYIVNRNELDSPRWREAQPIYATKIYNNTINAVYGEMSGVQDKLAGDAARHREMHRGLASKEPSARAHYDIHINREENLIVYIKAPCSFEDMMYRFFLHIAPADPKDLPESRKRYGYDNADFHALNRWIEPPLRTGNSELGSILDGRCLAAASLPDYPIAAITTGQFTNEGKLWTADINLSGGEIGPPAAASALKTPLAFGRNAAETPRVRPQAAFRRQSQPRTAATCPRARATHRKCSRCRDTRW